MLSLIAEIAKKVMPGGSAAQSNAASEVDDSVHSGDPGNSPPATSTATASPSFLSSLSWTDRASHLRNLRSVTVQRMLRVVTDLMHHKSNRNLFNAPVDVVALKIPDYFKYVKKPMDLGTIRKRLEADEYETLHDVERDVRLVFRNAMVYNPPSNMVHEFAQQLLTYFEERVKKLKESLERTASSRRSELPCTVRTLLHASWSVSHAAKLTQHAAHSQACGDRVCDLCRESCLKLESEPISCEGPCKQKILSGSRYYSNEGVANQHGRTRTFCRKCFTKKVKLLKLHAAKSKLVQANAAARRSFQDGLSLDVLSTFIQREATGYACEQWVACAKCLKWSHVVCALHNTRCYGRGYICYKCHDASWTTMPKKSGPRIRGKKASAATASSKRARSNPHTVSARNLLRTPLSDQLEARVKARVKAEWEKRNRADLTAAQVDNLVRDSSLWCGAVAVRALTLVALVNPGWHLGPGSFRVPENHESQSSTGSAASAPVSKNVDCEYIGSLRLPND